MDQNEDMLLNFVAWEQGLRRNLTSNLWKLNPAELAGAWCVPVSPALVPFSEDEGEVIVCE